MTITFEEYYDSLMSRLLEVDSNIRLEPYRSLILAAHEQTVKAAYDEGYEQCRLDELNERDLSD